MDAVAAEYARLGIINNPTYNNLRGEIIREGRDTALALYEALAVTINALPDWEPVHQAARLMTLRAERDQIDASIDRLNEIIAAETERQVKDAVRVGRDELRGHKETLRNSIRAITGDPDS